MGPPSQREFVGLLRTIVAMRPSVSLSAASITISTGAYIIMHDLAARLEQGTKALTQQLLGALAFMYGSLRKERLGKL